MLLLMLMQTPLRPGGNTPAARSHGTPTPLRRSGGTLPAGQPSPPSGGGMRVLPSPQSLAATLLVSLCACLMP